MLMEPNNNLQENSGIQVGMVAPPPAPVKRSPILLITAVVISAVILAGLAFLAFAYHKSPTYLSSNAPSALEKALQSKQQTGDKRLALIKQVKTDLYVPQNISLQQYTLMLKDDGSGHASLTFNHGVQFGRGITPGTYGFGEFPADAYYEPPTDCGMPSGGQHAGSIPCSYFGSIGSTKAYLYQGAGIGIQNTSVREYQYMYAQFGQTLVVIGGADASGSELFSIMKSMKKVPAKDLPEDTQVYTD